MPTARQELATAIENYLGNTLSFDELARKATTAVFAAASGTNSDEGKILEIILYLANDVNSLKNKLAVLGPLVGASI